MAIQTKIKHKWRVSYIVKNLYKCVYCGQERRKHKDGNFYTNPDFKTYCPIQDESLLKEAVKIEVDFRPKDATKKPVGMV